MKATASEVTGVHRDTIMRLGVRVGEACGEYLDKVMKGLSCPRIQVDEIWGFVGKKQRNLRYNDRYEGMGDVYTFVAIDPETKIVPSFVVGRRDGYHARMFMEDLAPRMTKRLHLSSDAMEAYPNAVERGFGAEVDYGQVTKVYSWADSEQRRYSPPEALTCRGRPFGAPPLTESISTSHIERQNLTMRMHCRRLTRLTNAFSKKLENLRAAIALHFVYYNLVKTHGSLRCTPAMSAGVLKSALSVDELVGLSN